MNRIFPFLCSLLILIGVFVPSVSAAEGGQFAYDFYNFSNGEVALYKNMLLRSDRMGLTAVSTDGAHWSCSSLPIDRYENPLSLFTTRTGFVIIEHNSRGQNYSYTSSDGKTFEKRPNNLTQDYSENNCVQTSGGILMLGNSLVFSTDGVNFISIVEDASSIYSIQVAGDRFFYFSDDGVYSSEDGIHFQRVALNGEKVYFYNGLFHLISSHVSSSNETVYTHFVSSGIRNFVSSEEYDSQFIMGCNAVVTLDGIDYAYQNSARYRFAEGKWREEGDAIPGFSASFYSAPGGVAARTAGGLFFSRDGRSFASMGDYRSLRTTLFYSNEYFYFEKDDGLAFRSKDGLSWEKIAKLPPRSFTSAFAGSKTLSLSGGKYMLSENKKNYPLVYEGMSGDWRISAAGNAFLLEKQGTVPEFYLSPDGVSRFDPKNNLTTAPHFVFTSHMASDGNIVLLCNASGLIYRTTIDELFYTEKVPRVMVNGVYLGFADQPVIRDNSTMVPIRFLAENMGYTVGWEASSSTVTVKKDGRSCSIAINSNVATVNGKEQPVSAPARLINGKTYLPLRFLSEAMGCSVNWDAATGTATIHSLF